MTTATELTPAEIADAIRTRERFVIVSHVRPDGDAIGSQMAMTLALRSLGKHVRAVSRDKPPTPMLGVSTALQYGHAMLIRPSQRGDTAVAVGRAREECGIRQPPGGKRESGSQQHGVRESRPGRAHDPSPTAHRLGHSRPGCDRRHRTQSLSF